MTFTFLNKPDPSDILSNSQADLKNNFQYLQGTLGKDHQIVFGDTNATTFEGRHTQVSLNNRANPNLALPGDGTDGFLYCSVGNLFWRGSASTSAIQMTGQNPVSSTNGKTFLPGGLLLQWGQSTTSSTAFPAAPTVSFTTPFGAPPYSIQCTVLQNSDNGYVVQVVTVAPGSFTVTTRNTSGGKVSGITYSWIAIGPS